MDVKAKTKTNYLNQESEHITRGEFAYLKLLPDGKKPARLMLRSFL